MTAGDLITTLRAFPADMRVVVDLHSEYAEANGVRLLEGYENRGYVSEVYNKADRAKAQGWVYISVSDGQIP